MSRFLHRHSVVVFPIVLLFTCLLFAQGTSQARKQTKEFDLSRDQKWLDTGIDVQSGDTLKITATGTVHYPSYKESGPEGLPRGWRDLLRIFPLSDANHGALIGRIGDDSAQSFLIGPSRESRVTTAGRFYLGLNQTVRHAFLSRYPDPVVPTYSLPAISDKTNTSKMLLQVWQLLSTFGDKQDSQLTQRDAIIPGSKYLGSALADHFAIALPFETSNESIRSGADKNHYPRTALLEAMVRFVIQDLDNPK